MLAILGAEIARSFGGWQSQFASLDQHYRYGVVFGLLTALFYLRKYLDYGMGRTIDILVNVEAARILGKIKTGIRLNDRWSRIVFPRAHYSSNAVFEVRAKTGIFAPVSSPQEIEAELKGLL